MSLTALSCLKAIICNSVFKSLSISNVILEMGMMFYLLVFLVVIILYV